jgi:hypothetical protein
LTFEISDLSIDGLFFLLPGQGSASFIDHPIVITTVALACEHRSTTVVERTPSGVLLRANVLAVTDQNVYH